MRGTTRACAAVSFRACHEKNRNSQNGVVTLCRGHSGGATLARPHKHAAAAELRNFN
jgi:hypothetical protein